MRNLLLISCLIIYALFKYNSFDNVFNIAQTNEPKQNAKNKEKPGTYKQILNANKTSIYPGDWLQVKYFITGYGSIDASSVKLYSSISANIMNGSESYLDLMYGFRTIKISNAGLIIKFDGALIFPNGKKIGLFDDSSSHPNSIKIMFEENDKSKDMVTWRAPFTWNFKTMNNIDPGKYYLNYVLTYYNGEKWQSDEVSLQITVLTWWEKHAGIIQISGIIIVFITITTFIFSIPEYIKTIKSLIR